MMFKLSFAFGPRKRLIEPETKVIGEVGLSLDCDSAREQGLTENEINDVWCRMSNEWRGFTSDAARRAGRTRQCTLCKCWTPPGACIHCQAGKYLPIVAVDD